MPVPPAVVVFVGLAGLLVFGASLTPAHAINGGTETADVEVTASVTWHSIRSEWTIDEIETATRESTWLNLRSFFTNLFTLTSPSRDVVFRLETPAGALVTEESERTGKGGLFGSRNDVTAVFNTVPAGEYVVRVQVVGPDGVLAERTRTLRIEVS